MPSLRTGCCSVPFKWASWIYYAGFLVVNITSWVLRDYSGTALDFGPAEGCTQYNTCGDLAVLRLSFGSMLFFATMCLLSLGVTEKDNVRVNLHTGFWIFKFTLWAGLIALTFGLPNELFHGYTYAAYIMSATFILIQLVVLLDFVYAINEWFLNHEANWARVAMVVGTLALIAATLTGMAFLYVYWVPSKSCTLNTFFITFALALFLVYGAISVTPIRPDSAGLLTSAVTFAYCMFYTWSALDSEPKKNKDGTINECSPGKYNPDDPYNPTGTNSVITIVGFLLVMFTVGFSTVNSGRSSSSFSTTVKGSSRESEDEGLPYRPDFFYFTFTLASAYVAMVLIGWGIYEDEQGEFRMDKGWGSVWAKMGASWICALLYLWSLVAHRILCGRDFS